MGHVEIAIVLLLEGSRLGECFLDFLEEIGFCCSSKNIVDCTIYIYRLYLGAFQENGVDADGSKEFPFGDTVCIAFGISVCDKFCDALFNDAVERDGA